VDEVAFWNRVRQAARKAGRAYLATVDAGRPRVRVVFPGFEGQRIWIATQRQSAKARQIQRDPNVELFWEVGAVRPQAHLTVSGTAAFIDDQSEKDRIWSAKLFGYNLSEFWPGGPKSATFGIVLVIPRRVELGFQPAMWGGEGPQVWIAQR
jgi:general stress protein 26